MPNYLISLSGRQRQKLEVILARLPDTSDERKDWAITISLEAAGVTEDKSVDVPT